MALIQGGTSTANVMNVNSNFEATVALQTAQNAGFATLNSEVDPGTYTGTRLVRQPEVSRDFRLRSGLDTPLFSDYFPGSNINTAIWNQVVSTQTIAVASGFLVTNSGSSVASAAVSRVQSYRSFNKIPTFGIRIEAYITLTQTPQTNNVLEFGLGLASGTTAPTDGTFFRVDATGAFKLIVNFNGTETQSASITAAGASWSANVVKHVCLEITDANVNLWLDDLLAATVNRPAGQGTINASDNMPLLIRNYNSGVVATAQQMKIGAITVLALDGLIGKPYSHIAAGNGGMAHQGQTGGTMGSTELAVNSSNGTAIAALSNTSIVGAQNTGFGGLFSFAAGVTAATNFIVQSFQNPAATAALPGANLFITGIKISAMNTGVAVATTATCLEWTLNVGATAVSLATTEGTGTKAPRRIPLGFQVWPIAAAVGTMPDRGDLFMPFNSPLILQPGEFLVTDVKFYIGTATASQVIVCTITFDGYYE